MAASPDRHAERCILCLDQSPQRCVGAPGSGDSVLIGLRGIVAGLVAGSAIISLPVVAQSRASSSLTHVVTVTVPPRVKVQVANLALSSPVPVSVSSVKANPAGLSVTVSATQAWVLAIGSASGASARKSHLQWSTDGISGFSTLTTANVAVASGVTAYDAKAASLFFRGAASGHAVAGAGDGEAVMLTVSAP
jgi:hypothetical protein